MRNGTVKIVKILAPLSENPNSLDPHGWTPLHSAFHYGHHDIIKVLEPYCGISTPRDPPTLALANHKCFLPITYAWANFSCCVHTLLNSYFL